MEIGEAVGRYEQAAALLPSRWQQAARRVPEHRKAQAEEFRLRAGRPMTLLTCEGELLVSDELPRQSVTQADLEQLCDAVTGYSRYAAAETMGKGYLIGRGERGELAGMYRGVPQLDVGCHTDVLDGCPKALGIPMLLRSANPQVIAVDEITEAADILAMTAAANCGVKLLATIHAEDGEELRRKPLFRQLAEAGVFRCLITISTAEGRRQYRTEAL